MSYNTDVALKESASFALELNRPYLDKRGFARLNFLFNGTVNLVG